MYNLGKVRIMGTRRQDPLIDITPFTAVLIYMK